LPWEESEEFIRSGHRNLSEFQPDSFRTILVSKEEGIKAIIGKLKGKTSTEVASFLFEKNKGWTIDKAKTWFEKHAKNDVVQEYVSPIFPLRVLEKIVDKPLRIKGIALTTGMSRNFNLYTPEELKSFAEKLVAAPIYVEHVAVPNAIGRTTGTNWDGRNLWFEAEIYDDEIAEKIRKGLVKHVSVGADYDTIDNVDGRIPHGLHNAELSLVAVPGIPEANIQIMEKLHVKEQTSEPIMPGEYLLGFYQDFSAFMPQYFTVVWLDKENGILALAGKLRAEPETQKIESIFFAADKMWDDNKIRDWLALHPDYTSSVNKVATLQAQSVESMETKLEQHVDNSHGSLQKQESGIAEKLLKNSRSSITVEEAVKMIQNVLPSSMVERSWGFGPQRLCQELRGVIMNLRKKGQ
jgi:hypothetical protein